MPEKSNPQQRDGASAGASSPDTCDACPPGADSAPAGPAREGGGTTGANNLSPAGASRTGGATGGVDPNADPSPKRPAVPPDPGD